MKPATTQSVSPEDNPVHGSSEGNILDRDKPIIATASLVDAAHHICAHRHRRGQLLFSMAGNMQVNTGSQRWYVTPQYAIWIASGDMHLISAQQAIHYRSVFVEPAQLPALFSQSGAIRLQPEFTSLLDRAASIQDDDAWNVANNRLHQKLLDGARRLQKSDFCVALPRQQRLRHFAEQMLKQPEQSLKLKDISQQLGLSERSILRFFQDETGLSFCQWRQQLLVTLALERMSTGQSLTRIALDLGYRSPAAFCTMFRRVTGSKPSKYHI